MVETRVLPPSKLLKWRGLRGLVPLLAVHLRDLALPVVVVPADDLHLIVLADRHAADVVPPRRDRSTWTKYTCRDAIYLKLSHFATHKSASDIWSTATPLGHVNAILTLRETPTDSPENAYKRLT